MEFDLASQPQIVQTAAGYALLGWDLAWTWLLSPVAWSQFGLLILAWVLALLLARRIKPALARLPDPGESDSILAPARCFLMIFLPLLLPIFAYGLTAAGEQITASIFGSSDVIAFGKWLFLLIAARILVRDMITDPFLKLLGRFVLIPLAALHALGLIELVATRLELTVVPLGNLSFNLLWLLQFIVIGGIIFWLGRWSNDQSTSFITAQEEMRPATRQLAVKAAEIAIFGAAFLVLMNIKGGALPT